MPKKVESKKKEIVVEAWCVKCGSKVPVEGGNLIDGSRPRYAGKCGVCHGNVSVFLSKDTADKVRN